MCIIYNEIYKLYSQSHPTKVGWLFMCKKIRIFINIMFLSTIAKLVRKN